VRSEPFWTAFYSISQSLYEQHASHIVQHEQGSFSGIESDVKKAV
jgi:hypothetical protein